MFTFKGEHKFTDKSSLSGLYIYNKTDEPGSTIMKADKLFMADQDQWFGPLRRRPHVLVFNSTNVLNDTTVLTLRYGWTTWQDSCDSAAVFAGHCSRSDSARRTSNALGPGGDDIFPSLHFDQAPRTSAAGGPVRCGGRARTRSTARCPSWSGSHSFKVGADMRRLGVALRDRDGARRTLRFRPAVHQPATASAATSWRACCSALPSTGSAPARPRRSSSGSRSTGAATSRTTGA